MIQGGDSPCLYGDFVLFRGCFDSSVEMNDFYNHRNDIDRKNDVPELDWSCFLEPIDFFIE